MLDFFEILFLAALQGVAEFLPISSSGHLVVFNHIFERWGSPLTGTEADFIKLSLLLHLGTLVAVLFVFRKRILGLLGKDFRLLLLLIVATIPGVLVGLLIKMKADWISENLLITALGFCMTGLLLLYTLRIARGQKLCATMSWRDALIIGCVQGLAVLPGLSRSGSTIVAGLCCKLRRDEAATFSFLLSIPIIAGGGLLELKDLFDAEPSTATTSTLSSPLLLIGMAVSCLVGVMALLWLLEWLKKGKLWYFAVWVFALVPLTLALAFTSPAAVTPNSTVAAPTAVTASPTQKIAVEAKIETKTTPKTVSPKSTADEQRQAALARAIADDDSPEREKLAQEEARRQYELILAEEAAREKAKIEEERKREPLVDDLRKLQLIDKTDRIWITTDKKSVILLGRVALREGPLELFACRVATKEHESIVSVRIKPYLVHLGLLLCGAESGKPVQHSPKFVAPSGDEIEVKIRWKDQNGKIQEAQAQDWVLDVTQSKKDENGEWTEKKTMATHWVFTGSRMYKDEAGKNHYIADESGELFGLSNFVGAILDVPVQSSAENANLRFVCNTEKIPEQDTPLTLILTPVKKDEETRRALQQ